MINSREFHGAIALQAYGEKDIDHNAFKHALEATRGIPLSKNFYGEFIESFYEEYCTYSVFSSVSYLKHQKDAIDKEIKDRKQRKSTRTKKGDNNESKN
ncbi:hypothetical protein M902_2335 [Bacteriovorax sp. BAL6_X]|uniref:hypothetical protein n=1 Tax=Bacteriovorax sp. BAL6_X TaxID=1201290 RepID=UPI0003865B2E|nr:hypothetical protein [Bacteriovorax sp. BAL6_X]EPZ52479.1 hypothetical protein M902_2335 [Bacteriovorax sp. BAL6_X]